MWHEVMYLRPGGRRPVRVLTTGIARDIQGDIPAWWCCRCGAEVFEKEAALCRRCARTEDNLDEEDA